MQNTHSSLKFSFMVFTLFLLSFQISFAGSCKLFKHKNYNGEKTVIHANEQIKHLKGANNEVSSIKVPNNCRLVTFIEPNFNGHKNVYKENNDDLGIRDANRISSAKCQCNFKKH